MPPDDGLRAAHPVDHPASDLGISPRLTLSARPRGQT